MKEQSFSTAARFDFTQKITYSDDGVVSKQILKKTGGNITLFAFDQDQELSEHSAPFDALVQVLEGKGEIIIDGISNILCHRGVHHPPRRTSPCREGSRKVQDAPDHDQGRWLNPGYFL